MEKRHSQQALLGKLDSYILGRHKHCSFCTVQICCLVLEYILNKCGYIIYHIMLISHSMLFANDHFAKVYILQWARIP